MMTEIGWTASRLQRDVHLTRDLRVDGKVLLPAGHHDAGTLVRGFTFNGWKGCEKVSRACKRCYAEAWAKRCGYTPEGKHHLRIWGPAATTVRERTSPAYWRRPLAWDRLASELGVRFKVFAHSLSDVGEDHPLVVPWREELFGLIDRTRHIDWLLLTKRTEHLAEVWPSAWREKVPFGVWVGATVEDQATADERFPHLFRINASEHFASFEPLAGRIDLDPRWLRGAWLGCGEETADPATDPCRGCTGDPRDHRAHGADACFAERGPSLTWAIGGGESGPGHEALNLDDLLHLHRQVTAAGIPFFTKQDSGPHPGRQGRIPDEVWATKQFPQRGELFQ